jgi:hypothetical protein
MGAVGECGTALIAHAGCVRTAGRLIEIMPMEDEDEMDWSTKKLNIMSSKSWKTSWLRARP